MPQLRLSKSAINQAIMAFEVSWSPTTGFATYNKKYARPVVPDPINTDSGVTVGIGYDCSVMSSAKIIKDWSSVLPADMVTSLSKCAGLKKQAAVGALQTVKNVFVSIEAALQVFYNNTIFSYSKQALSIYPNIINIHPIEASVIVSLVYNRGSALEGDRRREMKQLVGAINRDNDKEMADLIRSMCRLWPNTKGLQIRRKAEAALIEMADTPLPEEDILTINI